MDMKAQNILKTAIYIEDWENDGKAESTLYSRIFQRAAAGVRKELLRLVLFSRIEDP